MTLTTIAPPSNLVRELSGLPLVLIPPRPAFTLEAAGDDDAGNGKTAESSEESEGEDEDTGFEDDDLGFDGGFAPAEIEEFDEADFDDDFDDDFEEELDEDDLGDDDDNGVTETDDADDDFDDEE